MDEKNNLVEPNKSLNDDVQVEDHDHQKKRF